MERFDVFHDKDDGCPEALSLVAAKILESVSTPTGNV